jgi:glycosyltransferase involved in cell wall biosynthesis
VDNSDNAKNSITVVIPAYNEGLVIGSVVLNARQYAAHVIVVDDGSSDNTSEIARLAGAKVITLEKNAGKSNAMMIVFARAKEIGSNNQLMVLA